MIGKIAIAAVAVVVVAVLFLPAAQRLLPRLFGGVTEITVTSAEEDMPERTLEMVKVLGFDGIPAILDPEFVDVDVAWRWMDPDEQVLALSINGDHRAYPINVLSRHEIVNDTVGGIPVAVTW